ncbi:MAG: hypothetical protein Q9216_004677 [Gyalolechia sp. 2 TL-2023]
MADLPDLLAALLHQRSCILHSVDEVASFRTFFSSKEPSDYGELLGCPISTGSSTCPEFLHFPWVEISAALLALFCAYKICRPEDDLPPLSQVQPFFRPSVLNLGGMMRPLFVNPTLDWLHQYAYAEDGRMFDRRSSTVLEAADRLRRYLEQRDQQQSRELQERAERETLPTPRDSAAPRMSPIILIETSEGPIFSNRTAENLQDHRLRSGDTSERQSSSRSRQSSSSSPAAASQNQSPHPSHLDMIDSGSPETQEGNRRRRSSSSSSARESLGPLDNVTTPSDYHSLRSHEPSESPEPHNSNQGPSSSLPEDRLDEPGAGSQEVVEAVDVEAIRNDTQGNGPVDNTVESQEPVEHGGAAQSDNNDPEDENSPPRTQHDDIGLQPPLRLSVWTHEPHFRATLQEILGLPQDQSEGTLYENPIQSLFELVTSWFDLPQYRDLGRSMARLIDRTSTSEIPKDSQHEPTRGYALSGKRFAEDPPEGLERLRDRWNNTRSIRCLGNKFWQTIKFRLAAMELYVHWEYLQMVYKSKEPEFADEQAYIQRLLLDIKPVPGRKRVDILKRAIEPYLGIGDGNRDDILWKSAMRLGRRVAVLKAYWGLIALCKTKTLLTIPTSLLARTIPAFIHRHPSVRDISLVVFYNYVQPLWSEGSLDRRCRQFATSIKEGDERVKQACQENTVGLIGFFGYHEADEFLVPEMAGALPCTPSPRDAPMTPPPTRHRVSVDLDTVHDTDSDDVDVGSSSAEADSSSESKSEFEYKSRSPPVTTNRRRNSRIHPRSRTSGSSPTPSTRSGSGRVKRQRRRRKGYRSR